MKWNSDTAAALFNASKESKPEEIPAGEYCVKITASEGYTFEDDPDNYGALFEVTITRGQQKGKKLYKYLCFNECRRKENAKTKLFLRSLFYSCCVEQPEYTSPETLKGLSGYILKYPNTPQDFTFSAFNGHARQWYKLTARIDAERAERKERNKGLSASLNKK
jgi:hypothetical protein